MSAKKKGGTVVITGVVYPLHDENDPEADLLMLAGNDDEDYIVLQRKRGWELYDHLREEVRVRGRVRVDDGRRHIEVLDFEAVPEDEEDLETNPRGWAGDYGLLPELGEMEELF